MSVPKSEEIVTPNDVCPDLVTEAEFGHHRSTVREGIPPTRVWIFDSYVMGNKFKKLSHLPRFKRNKKQEQNG